jgi:hypothetical protein
MSQVLNAISMTIKNNPEQTNKQKVNSLLMRLMLELVMIPGKKEKTI